MKTKTYSKQKPTSLRGGRPVRVSHTQDCVKDLITQMENSPLSISDLSQLLGRDGSCGKTSQWLLQMTKEELSNASSQKFKKLGMGSPTEFLMLNTSESRKNGIESSLSDILRGITDYQL